jgi:hypothetical protein
MKTLFTIFVVAALMTFSVVGQKNVEQCSTVFKNKYALSNLIAGINSDNHGVQKQCVYYAGFYQVQETVDHLISLIKNSECEDIQKLAVLSLYEIKNKDGIDFLKDYSFRCKNPNIKRISKLAYQQYVNEK